MNSRERQDLIEQVTSSWRPADRSGGVRSHPAWNDLDAGSREVAHREAARQRRLEAALDEEGLSTTAKRVLQRIRGASSR